MAKQPARQIGKAKLLSLHKSAEACQSRMGEERQALGAKFEAAATSDNFNAKAYRALRPLLKMEPGPQAHLWRTIQLYAEHFDIGTQGDLEDVINADQAREEGQQDDSGEGEEGAGESDESADEVDSILEGMDTPELGRFRSAMASAATPEAVNRGLERFTTDAPDMADAALEIAQKRLAQINADQGGGEDLRPSSLKDAAATEAAQVVEVAKAADPKPRRARNKPASPAAEAAAANGIGGSTFGNAREPGTPTH